MFFYLVVLVISLLFSWLFSKKKERIYLIMSALCFIFVAGFRYNVGTDYMFRYVPDFIYMLQGNSPSNLELGFKLMVSLIQIFTINIQFVFLVISIFTYSLIYYAIYKHSKDITMSILTFFIGGFFFESMNIMRQYIAMVIIIYAFYYLVKNEWKKWIICIMIASLFHTMSLFFIISIVPKIFKNNLLKLIYCISIFLTIGILLKSFFIKIISFTRFGIYFQNGFERYTQGNFQIILFSLQVVILIIVLICYYKNEVLKHSDEFNLLISMQILCVFLCLSTASVYLFVRFVPLFAIFQIFLIPYAISFHNYNIKKRLIISIIICYCIPFTYLYYYKNVNECLPYQANFNILGSNSLFYDDLNE